MRDAVGAALVRDAVGAAPAGGVAALGAPLAVVFAAGLAAPARASAAAGAELEAGDGSPRGGACAAIPPRVSEVSEPMAARVVVGAPEPWAPQPWAPAPWGAFDALGKDAVPKIVPPPVRPIETAVEGAGEEGVLELWAAEPPEGALAGAPPVAVDVVDGATFGAPAAAAPLGPEPAFAVVVAIAAPEPLELETERSVDAPAPLRLPNAL